MGYRSDRLHNTHRVAALKQVGGFAAHDADDLLITCSTDPTGGAEICAQHSRRGLTPLDGLAT